MNFYVGQEVVAIRDHSQGIFKKGQEFVIRGIKKGCCGIDLDIGMNESVYISVCDCGRETIEHGCLWFNSNRFSPKQQLSETTYNEVKMWIEQGKELAILN